MEAGPLATTDPTRPRLDIDREGMPAIAVLLALGTFLCFALMDTSAKYLVLSGLVPIFVVWARFTTQAVVFLVLNRAWQSPARIFRVNAPGLQVLRGLLLPTSTAFNFAALQHLQLAETSTIFLASPMLVTALSGPMLGEWAGPRRWAAVIVGFFGVLLVVRPGTEVFSLPILWSIGCMAAYSVYSILTRKLAATESQESLVFYSCIFGAVGLAPFAFSGATMPSSPGLLALLCLIGVFGLVGHTLLVKASRLASAAKVAPFVYSQLLWMTALGFVIFGDVPDGWTMAGAAIIVASGFYIMARERNLGASRRAAA